MLLLKGLYLMLIVRNKKACDFFPPEQIDIIIGLQFMAIDIISLHFHVVFTHADLYLRSMYSQL